MLRWIRIESWWSLFGGLMLMFALAFVEPYGSYLQLRNTLYYIATYSGLVTYMGILMSISLSRMFCEYHMLGVRKMFGGIGLVPISSTLLSIFFTLLGLGAFGVAVWYAETGLELIARYVNCPVVERYNLRLLGAIAASIFLTYQVLRLQLHVRRAELWEKMVSNLDSVVSPSRKINI